MAFSTPRPGSGRKAGATGPAPIGEINVTPLVDVMLVLLIVFMVAAPLMTMGVPITLPQAASNPMPVERRPITVTVEPDGALSIDGEPVTLDTLVAQIATLGSEDTDERIYVRGDATASYGEIMQVMGALSAAGHSEIGLITLPSQTD